MTAEAPRHDSSRPVRVVVVGSINMDLVMRVPRLADRGQTVAGSDLSEIPGGKGANQAVAAARLGAQVALVGRVGDDAYGATLRQTLHDSGVDVTQVQVTPGNSGLAVICVEDSGENSIVIVSGANGKVGPADVELAEAVIAEADVLLLQLEIPLPAVAAALVIAQRHGVRVLLDPAPAIRDLQLDWSAIDFLCPNETELAVLLGRSVGEASGWQANASRDAMEAAAHSLAARGVGRVVVTLGAAGSLAVGGDGETIDVPAFPVSVVDATAAGDAYRGALAVALAEGQPERQALRFAAAAGALAASAHGAQPSLPSREAVDRLASTGDRSLTID